MKKRLFSTVCLLIAASLLCGCAADDPFVMPETDRPIVTSPDITYETLGPIDTGGDETLPPLTDTDGTSPAPGTTATDKVTDATTTPAVTTTDPVTTAPDQVTHADPPKPGSSVSFLFCGDNLCHDAVINNAKAYASGSGQTYNFLPIYDAVASYIKNADIAVVNQESQIAGDAGKIGGYPRFNTPEQMGDDLITLGFDVVTTANNHMLDNKTAGLKNSIKYWKTKPVLTVGGYENKSDYENIRTYEKNGITFAFLAYTEMTNSGRRAEDGYITPLLDTDTVKRQVAAAKKVADVVIVLPHWGDEDNFGVTSTQKKYAKLFAECNVDIVVGTHSHVAGKIEYLDRADGKKMLCAYSLGNFVSTMEYARNLVGLMLSLDVVVEDGSCVCRNVRVIPTVTYFEYTSSMKLEDRTGLKLYLLADFTDGLAEKHAYNEHEKDRIRVDRLKKYVTDTVDKAFLSSDLK
ncbi:MAG: CapA family protein [Clostridia bacterium]|nr:CapA family protein [Clostridia bacterium]